MTGGQCWWVIPPPAFFPTKPTPSSPPPPPSFSLADHNYPSYPRADPELLADHLEQPLVVGHEDNPALILDQSVT